MNINEEHNREVAKLYFEFFKHFTTISTAAGLVVLALQQQIALRAVLVIVSLAILGITLLLSIVGMVLVPTRAGAKEKFSQGIDHKTVRRLMQWTAGSFFTSILGFGVSTLLLYGSSTWVIILGLGSLLSVGALIGLALGWASW